MNDVLGLHCQDDVINCVFVVHLPNADIQTRNYHAGIEKYNQMVTTGSFSEIGSFIPGVKVLLQLALQLNI